MTVPKFSIVTPAYNSGNYIEATIRSIAEQDYPAIEHIVIDGGSNDGTLDILERYPHLQWISERDRGQSDAINKGFARVSGDIIAWQNADDLYLPGAFAAVAEVFATHPEVDVVYGNYQTIDTAGRVICDVTARPWNQWAFAHGRFVPMQPATFWRRRLNEAVGALDTNLNYCMDVDFFSRAARQGFAFVKLDRCLGQFRIHAESKTASSLYNAATFDEFKRVLASHFNYSPLDYLFCNVFYYRGVLVRWLRFRLLPQLGSGDRQPKES